MKYPFYRIIRPGVTFLAKLLYRPTIVGKENIPKEGRIVLAGNHTSFLDAVIIFCSTKRTVHFLAKHTLLKGWKKYIFGPMGIVPVDRTIHDKDALYRAKELLEEERVIGIFPESTINREKKTTVLPFKIGAVKMAHDTKTPIVPFVITGKSKLLRKSVRIEFFEKIHIKSDNLTKENDKLMKIISDELEKRENK